ncbi:MAG: rod shape-determining protein RodA [Kiritimatiellae bacterium]|nr:rod shape-determining protein RodA [Kiritimatiellia bacterium]
MIAWRALYQRIQKMDWLMGLAMIVLCIMGVLFIYSASYQSESLPVSMDYKKQMIWVFLGLTCYLFFTVFDYVRLSQYAYSLYGASLALLMLVLWVGAEINGATRWLNVFGLYVQPSELCKLSVVIVLAQFLGRPGRNLSDFKNIFQPLLLVGVPLFLIYKEPDLGTALVLIPILLGMLYVAGVPVKILAFLVLAGLMLSPFAWFGLGEYQQNRIIVLFDEGRDPLGAAWNKIQSEIAVGSGGLTGKGFLKGTQNILGFLPRTVAPTDFIYSVIAEELGFIGSLLLLTLFSALCIAGMRAALQARDKFGVLLVVGFMTMLFTHVFVNIAMTIGLLPITGLPLPLISYGGSFMVSTMAALGMVQSVYVRRICR